MSVIRTCVSVIRIHTTKNYEHTSTYVEYVLDYFPN